MTLRSTYSGRKALVTGGLGFIGSNIAAALNDMGAEVVVVDSQLPGGGANLENIAALGSSVRFVPVDIRDRQVMRTLLCGCDFVFNLAAQTGHAESMRDPQLDLAINVEAQLALLESVRETCPAARIVFTSTRQVYGRPERLPVDETHPVRPIDVNGINKHASENYHLLYDRVHGIHTSVLRLTNTFGPGMRITDGRQMFLGLWIRRLLEGASIQIYGDGSQRRDLLFVADCVQAMLRVAASVSARGSIFNLGGAETVRLSDLARRLVDVGRRFGLHSDIEFIPFPGERRAIDIGDYVGDHSRMERAIGWAPSWHLDDALSRTVEYYLSHADAYLLIGS